MQGAGRSKNAQDSLSATSSLRSGMTEGQIYKFAFLWGLFLTNAGRCFVLIYDGLSHTVAEKSEE